MPFLFVGLILVLMAVANKKPSAAAGASAGALRRQTSEPIYDIGEEVMVPRISDWGVIEEARLCGDSWVYGIAVSHGRRVRVRECDVCEE
jgi:hypothetical protein